MNAHTITTGRGLQQYVALVFEQGVKSSLAQKALTEKEKQVATSGKGKGDDVDSLFGSDDEGDKKTSKTMDDETEKLKHGDIKPKDIIEKLNSIRSGRSFKDSAVSGSMDEYINSLSKAEKVALMAFLKGISQIVTGEVSASNADEPSDQPSDVKMNKGNETNVVHKKPNVIRGIDSGQKKQNRPPEEDTTPPAPITPKKR